MQQAAAAERPLRAENHPVRDVEVRLDAVPRGRADVPAAQILAVEERGEAVGNLRRRRRRRPACGSPAPRAARARAGSVGWAGARSRRRRGRGAPCAGAGACRASSINTPRKAQSRSPLHGWTWDLLMSSCRLPASGAPDLKVGPTASASAPDPTRACPSTLPGFIRLSGSSASLMLPHHVDRLAVLGFERRDLAVADAVLAGAGAAHRQRARDHPLVVVVDLRQLGLAGRIDQVDDVEVAVAGMADQADRERRAGVILLGLDDAVGQAGDRHAHVGRPGRASRGRSASDA